LGEREAALPVCGVPEHLLRACSEASASQWKRPASEGWRPVSHQAVAVLERAKDRTQSAAQDRVPHPIPAVARRGEREAGLPVWGAPEQLMMCSEASAPRRLALEG
jgi:hypothetical protein